MPQVNKLIFHIGVPKTGSSLIQRCLRALRPALRDRGVVYIDRTVFRRIPSHTAWGSYGRKDYQKEEFFEALLAQVERELQLDERPTHTLLISNEAAAGRSRPPGRAPFWPGGRLGVGEIIELLKPKSTELMVYIRRQDTFLESLFMQQLHRGDRKADWEVFRKKVTQDDRVRYTDLIDGVKSLPTVDGLRVRPFEIIQAGAPAFVADFLTLVDSADLVTTLAAKRLKATNPAYSHPAWQAAGTLNQLLDRPGQAKQVRRFLHKLFPTDLYPRAQQFTEEERLKVLRLHHPDNKRLYRKYMPEFPNDSYSTLTSLDSVRTFLTPIELPEEEPATSTDEGDDAADNDRPAPL